MARNHKLGRAIFAACLMTATMAAPASATKPNADGEHKVEICHVTNSAKNPYVVIEVDVAAFDGEGKNDHTQHMSKDGRVDQLYVDGECGDGGTTGGTLGDEITG